MIPIKRVRYFTGQLLGVSDFQDEQDYILRKQRLRNLSVGAGIVSGLRVSTAPDGLHVTPGLAIDPLGQEIIVTEPQLVPYPPGNEGVALFISYTETFTDPVPMASGSEFTRIEEGFSLDCASTGGAKKNVIELAKLQRTGGKWKVVNQSLSPFLIIGIGVFFLAVAKKISHRGNSL